MGYGMARLGLVCALALGMAGCGKTDDGAKTGAAEQPAQAGAEQAGAEKAPEAEAAKGDAPEGDAAEKGEAAKAEAGDVPAKAAAPTGTIPAVMAALSARHTVAVGGFEGLDEMARIAATFMSRLPPELQAEMKKDLPNGFDTLVERMGFDPRDAKAWATVGLDPAAGVAVVVDDRLKAEAGEPWPLVLARVSDRGKLVAALGRIDEGFELGLPGTDGVAELTTPGGKALLGMRGDFTALLPLMDEDEAAAKAARAAFASWSKAGDPPLSAAEGLKPALTFPGTSRSYGVVVSRPLLRLMAGQLAPVFADFYQARFPALSLSVSSDMKHGALRLLGDAAAVAALRKILVSPHPAPDLDRFAAKDGMVVGFAVNPVDLFDGVVALVPPERGDVQGQVLIGKNAVPVVLGASLDDLGKGLSGHVAVILPAGAFGAQGAQKLVVAVGVADAQVLDRILPAVLDRLAQQASGKRSPTKFGELEGHVLEGAGPPTFAVRAGDALLLGPDRAAIEAALARQGAAGGPQLDLSGGIFYGAAVPLSLMDTAMADAPPEAMAMLGAAKDFWRSRFGDGFHMALRVDDQGIRSDGVGATMLLGVGAAVAIPAFMKYIQRSKAAQARVELGQLFLKASLARMEQKALTEAPLTPAADPCADGGDGSYEATAATWSHPTWKALGFAPIGKQYYRYAFEPGEGQGFTVKAVGDLDCDGVQAEYIQATDAEGQRVPDVERNPLE